jgi:hypothetical protein
MIEPIAKQEYLGLGNLADYSFDFKITDLNHLLLIRVDTTGAEVFRVRGGDTVFLDSVDFDASEGGGTVHLIDDLPIDHRLILLLANDDPQQPSEFKSKFDFTLSRIEAALDYITGALVRASYLAKRSLKLSDLMDPEDFDPTYPSTLADNPDATILINPTGDGFVIGPTGAQIAAAEGYSIAAAASAAASATSATASASSATASAGSATASAASAVASAASAAAASATVAGIGWNDIVYKSFADSPVSILDGDKGKLFVFDCTGGNIAVTLPLISGLTLTDPWEVGLKKSDSSANTVTATASGADTVNIGGTTKVLSVQGQSTEMIPDTDLTPDDWSTLDFGSTINDVFASAAFANDNRLLRSDGTNRNVQASGITVSDTDAVSGLTQLDVDNIRVDGNTVSSTDVNGNVELEPNGTGLVRSTKQSAWTGAAKFGNNSAPVASALVEMVSTSQGLLPPRMTTAQKNAIASPATGLVVYDTDLNGLFAYNGTVWSAMGSGGGGGALQWVEASGNTPTPTEENLNKVYLYESAQAQELYAAIKVPSSYVAGNQINLKVPWYSPDVSGTALIQTVATLIRSGTDAITSTTNQRTSTNAAVNLATAALADKLNNATCDLTSSTGQINSVAVSAGDLILVKLTRGTDTATSDIRALVYGAEGTFS